MNRSLDYTIEFLELMLDINHLDEEQYCIHDCDLYVLGDDEINNYKDSKILTNIRNQIVILS